MVGSISKHYQKFVGASSFDDVEAALSYVFSDISILRAYEVTQLKPSEVPKGLGLPPRSKVDELRPFHIDAGYRREGKQMIDAIFPELGEKPSIYTKRLHVSPEFQKHFKVGLPFRLPMRPSEYGPVASKAVEVSRDIYGFPHKDIVELPISPRRRIVAQAKTPLDFEPMQRLSCGFALYLCKCDDLATRTETESALALKPRELECIRWLAAGKSLEDVAELTNLSYRTVRYHLDNARERFGYSTNMQLIVKVAQIHDLNPLF